MQDVLRESESKMQKAIEVLRKNFSAVRTGRANPALLDHVNVNYYGTSVPLKQLASISVPEFHIINGKKSHALLNRLTNQAGGTRIGQQ